MKNKIILLCIFTSFLYNACDDALDVKPENYLFEEQLVTDDKSAQTSLTGVYTQLNWLYAQYFELVPPIMDGSLTPTASLTGIWGEAKNNTFDSSNAVTNTMYEWPYYIVNSANATIKAVSGNEAVSQTERDRILSEAYFLRAFGHYQALRLFGQFFDTSSNYGIVIRDKLSTVENSQKARSTVQESYDFILSDLDKSIDLNAPFSKNYYASAVAAKAFKANILMYMGGDANYTEAINLANEVIASGAVSLETKFEDVFLKGSANREVIFSRTVGTGQSNKLSSFFQTNVKASTWVQNYLLGDPRAAASYLSTTKVIKKIYTTSLTASPTNYLRLAEVYLIKAECQARLNLLSQAETTLNVIRNRAYSGAAPALVYTTKEHLLDLIFSEYVKELCFETGAVWFAAIRYGKLETLRPSITSTNQYILPIPISELETNLEFGAQNPGYLGL
ncbi:RagB/SusD family nutrient uptake outer membrane protein [Mariniflexile maritimum]|uniref:RagB/SusD family nutrient uptake outer membrane protein n=1 Tax=Mariniflexile maritimum TaxID=2682493 RepID=UPI0012F672C1|nr:RagB/SusD family nutrient uptake outer membrane protein [Mariniflexile maritimum]